MIDAEYACSCLKKSWRYVDKINYFRLNGSLRVNTKSKSIVHPTLIPNFAQTFTQKTRANCCSNNGKISNCKAASLNSNQDRVIKSGVLSNPNGLQDSVTSKNNNLPNDASPSNKSDTVDNAVKNTCVTSGTSKSDRRLNLFQSLLLCGNSPNVKNFGTPLCERKKCEETAFDKSEEISLVKEENSECFNLGTYFSPITPSHLNSNPILNSLLDNTPITPLLECSDVNTLPSTNSLFTNTDELQETSFSTEASFSSEVLVESSDSNCSRIDKDSKLSKSEKNLPSAKTSSMLEAQDLPMTYISPNQDHRTGDADNKTEGSSIVSCALSSSGSITLSEQTPINHVINVRSEALYDFHNDAELDVATIVLALNHQRKPDRPKTETSEMILDQNSTTVEETERQSIPRLGKENYFMFSKKGREAGDVEIKSKSRKKQDIEEVVKKIYALHDLQNTSTAVILRKGNGETTIGMFCVW